MRERDIIKRLIKKYKTNNPMEISNHLGIITVYENLGSINGYYNTAYRQKFIHINNSISRTKQLFTFAHELGHAIMHPKLNNSFLTNKTFFSVNKFELQANKFAVHLLISDEELQECFENEYTLEQISSYFDLHSSLIKIRLSI